MNKLRNSVSSTLLPAMRSLVVAIALFAVAGVSSAAELVNLNKADAAAIQQSLVGIGPIKAEAIVSYRKKSGKFKSIDDLLNVKGIGPALIKKNKRYMSLSKGVVSGDSKKYAAAKKQAKAKQGSGSSSKSSSKESTSKSKSSDSKTAKKDKSSKKTDKAAKSKKKDSTANAKKAKTTSKKKKTVKCDPKKDKKCKPAKKKKTKKKTSKKKKAATS